MSNKENKSKIVVNVSERSDIAEYLVNNPDCANNYNLKRFKNIRNSFIIFDLINLRQYVF